MAAQHSSTENHMQEAAKAISILCDKPCTLDCNGLTCAECAAEIETVMVQHHQRQLALCSDLETIADGLPDGADTQHMLVLSRSLFGTVKSAHDFEEQRVFPFIMALAKEDKTLSQSLERLQFEHYEDESFAEELSDGLRKQVMHDDPNYSETLSYMLRGFFEGMRRHIAFEVEHVLPLLQKEQRTA